MKLERQYLLLNIFVTLFLIATTFFFVDWIIDELAR